jgi:hypothetical protein
MNRRLLRHDRGRTPAGAQAHDGLGDFSGGGELARVARKMIVISARLHESR